jgi:hypothetical protein
MDATFGLIIVDHNLGLPPFIQTIWKALTLGTIMVPAVVVPSAAATKFLPRIMTRWLKA